MYAICKRCRKKMDSYAQICEECRQALSIKFSIINTPKEDDNE